MNQIGMLDGLIIDSVKFLVCLLLVYWILKTAACLYCGFYAACKSWKSDNWTEEATFVPKFFHCVFDGCREFKRAWSLG